MVKPIRILHIGLGPLGQMLGPYLAEKDHLKLVGAIDIDPEKAGRDLGTLYGLERPLDVAVASEPDARTMNGPDVAVVTTVSELRSLFPTLERDDLRRPERRLHMRGTGVSLDCGTGTRTSYRRYCEGQPCIRTGHRCESGVPDGLSADRGHSRLPEREIHPDRTHPGCLPTASALPPEDRRRTLRRRL